MKQILFGAVAAAIIIISLSIGYYFVFALPRLKDAELKAQSESLRATTEAQVEDAKETRRIQRIEECEKLAGDHAKDLLKKKAEMTGLSYQKEAAERDLFLVDDYEFSKKECFHKYNID